MPRLGYFRLILTALCVAFPLVAGADGRLALLRLPGPASRVSYVLAYQADGVLGRGPYEGGCRSYLDGGVSPRLIPFVELDLRDSGCSGFSLETESGRVLCQMGNGRWVEFGYVDTEGPLFPGYRRVEYLSLPLTAESLARVRRALQVVYIRLSPPVCDRSQRDPRRLQWQVMSAST